MSRRWPRLTIRFILMFIALLCVLAGLRTRTVERQARAVNALRQLGGQLDKPTMTVSAWFKGIAPSNDHVTFLGPKMGDESIDDIIDASTVLDLHGITFMETRISQEGQQTLRTQLSHIEIAFVTLVLAPTDFESPRR